jgi:DNA mismatch endonuclease (patch repair protein)
MAAIRSRDTKPELLLRRTLYAQGVRGWRLHRRDLPGRPDLAFGPPRVAVFVDGAFWHGHPEHFTPGRSGDYWDAKIARNRERDRDADAALAAAGWVVMRFWDFEVLEDAARCARLVAQALTTRRSGCASAAKASSLSRAR